jgi:hypothetical protein
MIKKPPPRRGLPKGPASPEERYSLFATRNFAELARLYGTIEDAGRRYRELRAAGELREPPGERSEVFWATEPRVPPGLRPVKQPPGARGFQVTISRGVAASRLEWLDRRGHISSEERERAERYGHLRIDGMEVE